MSILTTILNLAWSWFGSNIKLPFGQEQIKKEALDIAYNQGLPALVNSLENMVPQQYQQNLNHPMWKALKQAANTNDSTQFVEQASSALTNSGQADAILKHIQQ